MALIMIIFISFKCHALAAKQSGAEGGGLTGTSVFDSGRFTHSESLGLHLELLKFMLKEGELYLSWNRCEELWKTLVSNPDAVEVDRDKIFEWFQACIRDLEETTQRRLFTERYLQLDPERVTENTFESFKTFFESVNVQCEAMKKPLNTVERPDALVGVDYVWRLATESPSERITNLGRRRYSVLLYVIQCGLLMVQSFTVQYYFYYHTMQALRNI